MFGQRRLKFQCLLRVARATELLVPVESHFWKAMIDAAGAEGFFLHKDWPNSGARVQRNQQSPQSAQDAKARFLVGKSIALIVENARWLKSSH